jgi:SAM-dependent methyltransferase
VRPPARPDVPPWEPQGRALAAYLAGDREAVVQVHCADGESETVEAGHFFRDEAALQAWESAALVACRGRVVDLGAGAGCHALALQRRGHAVVAVDVDPRAVEVMTARGVADARCGGLSSLPDGCADTLLLLQHGAGLAGDGAGLVHLLTRARRVLAPDGVVLLDSRDPDEGPAPPPGPLPAPEREQGRELVSRADEGVAALWLEHAGLVGAAFCWIFVGAPTLAALAARAGWRTEVLHTSADGRYLARLRGEEGTG